MLNGYLYVILVQKREGAIMPLATIPTNVKKDDAIASVLASRMEPIIATVWKKKLRPRDHIWSVLQSPNSEASQKMYFASEHVYANMNKLVQCYKTVKLCKNFVNIALFPLLLVCVITLVF